MQLILFQYMKQLFHRDHQLISMNTSSSLSRVFMVYDALIMTIIFLSSIICCEGRVQLPPNTTVPAIFAYGDSIMDQGNNNGILTIAKANFPPYGKDFEGGIPTGRFGNGKTPPDLAAEELGIANLIPAYLDPSLKIEDLLIGASFASGGSGFDPETAKIPNAMTLSDQLELFKEYIGKLRRAVGEERKNFILNNALHIVAAGAVDLVNTYFTAGINRRLKYDISSYGDFLTAYASDFVKQLYNLGARKIAVFGLPPLGCLPSQRTIAGGPLRMCKEEYNKAAQIVNVKLSRECDSLTQSLAQSRVVYIDVYNPFLDIVQRPQNYGFEVNDRGCCGTGLIEVIISCNKFSGTCSNVTKYVFWDSYHPSERAYKLLVNPLIEKYISNFM